MTIFKDFESYNAYVGLPAPLDHNIDIGYYDDKKIRLQSDPVVIDFYRVSIKSNFIDKIEPDYNPGNPKPITAVFFKQPRTNKLPLFIWDRYVNYQPDDLMLT